MDRLECDFYDVELDEKGNKRIHVWGYCYHSECNEDGLEYRNLQYCFFYLPIGFTDEQYEAGLSGSKQYIDDCDEATVVKLMDAYEASPMPMRSVTQATPCGTYIDN